MCETSWKERQREVRGRQKRGVSKGRLAMSGEGQSLSKSACTYILDKVSKGQGPARFCGESIDLFVRDCGIRWGM